MIGIDHGDRRFGLAVSDPLGQLARPLEVVETESELLRRLVEVIEEQSPVARIVVGYPLNMDGSVGPKARQVDGFCERLRERVALPVETWDERLTTVQAERALRESAVPARRRRAVVDMMAAQILLQSYLDARS